MRRAAGGGEQLRLAGDLWRRTHVDRAVGLGTEPMLKIGVRGIPSELVARLEPLVAAGGRVSW